MEIEFDFLKISTIDVFYKELAAKVELPDHFGNNLDALNDLILGEMRLPLSINFINVSLLQLETFEDLIYTLEEITIETDLFEFACFIRDVDEL